MKTWTIYCHINKLNGKRYIGQTSERLLCKCWRGGHGYSIKDQKVFATAVKKYGWKNFEHQILESNIETYEKASEREQYWIAYYHTWIYDPQCNGYNMTIGGGHSNSHPAWNKGIPATAESKKAQSERLKGRKLSEEHKNAIKLGMQKVENSHNIAIYCKELNKVYKSAVIASNELNILRTSITNCLHGRSKTAGGYHWEYCKKEK